MHAHCTVCGSVIEAESALCADCRTLVIRLSWGMTPSEADHFGYDQEELARMRQDTLRALDERRSSAVSHA
jgi:hypothetical protein